MFTGIIEDLGKVVDIEESKTNIEFTIHSELTDELKIDQSVCHNGVCLTVTAIEGDSYKVTAILETLNKTNLGRLKKGDAVNLERCLKFEGRIDGHIVQGHVDTKGICKEIRDKDGSWEFEIEYPKEFYPLIISKGSVTINGVSLTVVDPISNRFKVAIIPYTYEHTNFKDFKIGDEVNLEFDIIGKYIQRMKSFESMTEA